MTPRDVIEYYGSQRAVGAAIGRTQQAISLWVMRGEVPADVQYRIEVITDGKLRADRPAQRA